MLTLSFESYLTDKPHLHNSDNGRRILAFNFDLKSI
jgi:hypothetical protein